MVTLKVLITKLVNFDEFSFYYHTGALRQDSHGYLEIFIDNQWGLVCHDANWDRTDAIVVCRQLGFTDEARVQLLGNTSKGSGQIVASEVSCEGSEQVLIDCQMTSGTSGVTCDENKKAGVDCGEYF